MRISDWSCVCSSDLSKQTLAGPSKDKMMSNLQSHQTSPTEADIAAAKNAWNAVADEFNQRDNLSVDEQEKWQGRFADHADAQFPALARLGAHWRTILKISLPAYPEAPTKGLGEEQAEIQATMR